jgi:ribose 5-phosphate isomerase B
MKIAVAADERTGIADALAEELRKRGHDPIPHGALNDDERDDLGVGERSRGARRRRGSGRSGDRVLLDRHRRFDRRQQGAGLPCRALRATPRRPTARASWNDANVLALSLRTTSEDALARSSTRGSRRAVVRRGRRRLTNRAERERRHRARCLRRMAAKVRAGRCSRHRPAVDATKSRHAGHP